MIAMDMPMNNDPPLPLDMAAAAKAAVRDHVHFIDDLAQAMYPKSAVPPSEQMVAACRQSLRDLVSDIESRLFAIVGDRPDSWRDGASLDILVRGGLTADRELVTVLGGQAILRELMTDRGFSATLPNLFDELADHADPAIAAAAKGLSAMIDTRLQSGHELPEDLPVTTQHLLCWRIVAALERLGQGEGELLMRAASVLLGRLGETHNLLTNARKLAFLVHERGIEAEMQPFFDPLRAGPVLLAAAIGERAGASPRLFLSTFMDGGPARLSVLLRAAGVDQLTAAAIFGHFGRRFSTADVVNAIDGYETIDEVRARAMVAGWQEEADENSVSPDLRVP